MSSSKELNDPSSCFAQFSQQITNKCQQIFDDKKLGIRINNVEISAGFEDTLKAFWASICDPGCKLSALMERCCWNHERFLLGAALPSLIDFSKCYSTSENAIIICRCMVRLLQILSLDPDGLSDFSSRIPEILEAFLNYVWLSWDHFIELIKHESVDIFNGVLSVHKSFCDRGCSNHSVSLDSCSWFEVLVLKPVLAANPNLRAKYRCLLSIAQSSKIDILADMLDRSIQISKTVSNGCYSDHLLELIHDQSLSPMIAELFCYFLSAMNNANVSKWVKSLAEKLVIGSHRARMNIKERVVPVILKSNFALLPLLLDFLNELSICNKSTSIDGETIDNYQEKYLDSVFVCCVFGIRNQPRGGAAMKFWRDFEILENSLEDGLSHSNSEIRSSAFSILSDHPKTTEPVLNSDLCLMRNFLVANFNSPNPSFRQKLLTGMKKVFIRLRDSSHVIWKEIWDWNRQNKSLKGREFRKHETVIIYKEFMKWLFKFCIFSLQEGSNFGRKMTSLGILRMVLFEDFLKSADKSAFHNMLQVSDWFDELSVRRLLATLSDTYEQNQTTSLEILKWLPGNNLTFLRNSEISKTAWDLAKSNKPSDTNSAGFFFKFLTVLESKLDTDRRLDIDLYRLDLLRKFSNELKIQLTVAERDLVIAANSKAPIYGVLRSVNAVLEDINFRQILSDVEVCEQMRSFLENDLFSVCERISDLIAPIVHSMSPEGFMPSAPADFDTGNTEENEDSAEARQGMAGQAVLVCCWRSQKEISGIFGFLSKFAPIGSIISENQMEKIGKYYWNQLTECKHRGAFETAYGGFLMLTERLWNEKDNERMRKLPEKWLEEIVIDYLQQDRKAMEKLSVTRRSAGLPFLIQGILATEPKSRCYRSMKWVFEELLTLASEDSTLDSEVVTKKIHACNILKALFRETRLGEPALAYAAEGIVISVTSFVHESWAVRNAATQLFAALMIRIFGVPRVKKEIKFSSKRDQQNWMSKESLNVNRRKNCMSSEEFFGRFPSLYDFLFKQLDSLLSPTEMGGQKKSGSNLWSLYPSLLLLSRIYPSMRALATTSTSGGVAWKLKPFIPLVLRASMECEIMKIRETAVDAILALADKEDLILIFEKIFYALPQCKQNNALHGSLILIQKAFELELLGKEEKWFNLFLDSRMLEGPKQWPSFNQQAWLAVIVGFEGKIGLGFTRAILNDETLLRSSNIYIAGLLAKVLVNGINHGFAIPNNLRGYGAPVRAMMYKEISTTCSIGRLPSINTFLCNVDESACLDVQSWTEEKFVRNGLKYLLWRCQNSSNCLDGKLLDIKDLFRLKERLTSWKSLNLTLQLATFAARKTEKNRLPEILSWIESFSTSESDVSSREACLDAIKNCLDLQFIDRNDLPTSIQRSFWNLLQDDAEHIRGMAASIFSAFFSDKKEKHSKNSMICFQFLIRNSLRKTDLEIMGHFSAGIKDPIRNPQNGSLGNAEKVFERSDVNSYLEPFEMRMHFEEKMLMSDACFFYKNCWNSVLESL